MVAMSISHLPSHTCIHLLYISELGLCAVCIHTRSLQHTTRIQNRESLEVEMMSISHLPSPTLHIVNDMYTCTSICIHTLLYIPTCVECTNMQHAHTTCRTAIDRAWRNHTTKENEHEMYYKYSSTIYNNISTSMNHALYHVYLYSSSCQGSAAAAAASEGSVPPLGVRFKFSQQNGHSSYTIRSASPLPPHPVHARAANKRTPLHQSATSSKTPRCTAVVPCASTQQRPTQVGQQWQHPSKQPTPPLDMTLVLLYLCTPLKIMEPTITSARPTKIKSQPKQCEAFTTLGNGLVSSIPLVLLASGVSVTGCGQEGGGGGRGRGGAGRSAGTVSPQSNPSKTRIAGF